MGLAPQHDLYGLSLPTKEPLPIVYLNHRYLLSGKPITFAFLPAVDGLLFRRLRVALWL